MSQMLELKDTKKHKTHNIQPQHEHGGTRVSGSFSNLRPTLNTVNACSKMPDVMTMIMMVYV